MKRNKIVIIFLSFFIFHSFAQDKIQDYKIFYTELDSANLYKTEFRIKHHYDSLNISDLIFGVGFEDSIQLIVNNLVVYQGKIKSDLATYIVEKRWSFNRSIDNNVQIIFNNQNCLEFNYEKEFRFLKIDRKKGKYFLTYSKTNAFNQYK